MSEDDASGPLPRVGVLRAVGLAPVWLAEPDSGTELCEKGC